MLKITLFLMLAVTAASAQIIAKATLFQIHKTFPTVSTQLELKIDDPITEKAPNKKIFKLMNNKGKIAGWMREVGTDTGCKSACLPLNFSLLFDSKGKYAAFFTTEPLTKKNHRLFKESDNMQLELIMGSNGPGLGKELVPMDLIDAITMATHNPYREKVVPDAALTTLRMLQYKRQTEEWIKRHTSSGLRGN